MKINLAGFIANRLAHSNESNFMNFAQLVALLSVTLGSFALILSLSILNGFETELRKTAKKFTSDIAIYTINESYITADDSIKSVLTKIPNIVATEPVLFSEGLASTKEFTEGIALQSISAKDSKAFAERNFDKNIIVGEFNFSTDNAKEVIIGETLARKLGTKLGSKILLYALKDADVITFSSATYSQFVVKAIYRTGMLQYDGSVVFIPYKTLLDFLELPKNTATYIEVFLSHNVNSNIEEINKISTKIADILGFPFYPLTYHDLNRSIFAWIELQKKPIPLVLAIISIVAILNVVTTLIITVVEKTHTIGILRTLGLQNKNLISIFVFQGAKMAFWGLILGSFLAFCAGFSQSNFGIISLDSSIYFLDKLPIKMEWYYFAIVSVSTLFFSLLASFLPALIACKISPLKAIRFR